MLYSNHQRNRAAHAAGIGVYMKTALLNLSKVFKIFETIMKYVLVAGWTVCLLTGGTIGIGAAIIGIIICAVTCLV